MFYHQWCRTNAALMRTSINNPMFSSNCTTWLIDVHPTCSGKTFLKCFTSFRLIWNSAICSGMCTYISYQYPSTTFIYNGCLSNWVMMDAMARNQGTKMHWLLFQLQCLVKMQAWCWMPILQRVLRWRAGYAISGISPKLLPSTPAWPLLLDKVYWNFTITLNFEDDLGSEIQFINWLIHHLNYEDDHEDDLGSWAQFQKLVQTTFELSQIINTWFL